jgi:hypothetical protein
MRIAYGLIPGRSSRCTDYRLQDGQTRDRGSIPRRCKQLFLSLKHSDRFWGSTKPSVRWFFAGGKVARMLNGTLSQVLIVRMCDLYLDFLTLLDVVHRYNCLLRHSILVT